MKPNNPCGNSAGERRACLLRDIARSGGIDRWDHLRSHGHSAMTILAAVRRGLVRNEAPKFILTDDGRAAIDSYRK